MLPVFYETRPENLFVGPICDHPFPCHVHDVTEAVCLKSGRVEMTVGGVSYQVRPGDILAVFPSIPHSYDLVSEDASGLTLILTPDAIPELNRIFRSMRPAPPLLPAPKVPQELSLVVSQLESISLQADSPLRLAYMHVFYAHLFMAMELQPVERGMLTDMTGQALHYISSHFTEPLSLESTARALGVSRIHLSHIFSQQLKINFRQYINSLRIDKACTLLRNPSSSISQVAWQCGYGNLRTFHRSFLAQVGMPPNQFRARYTGVMEEESELPD